MLIVKIFQGPGNQLFQYAYGLAAAKRIGAELKLDTTWFKDNSSHRAYILDRFGITTPIATQEEIDWVKTCNGKNFLEYRYNLLRNKFASRGKKVFVKEDLSKFDSELLYPSASSYIEGYFSTAKFFQDFETDIRAALQFQTEETKAFESIAQAIDDSTIALSVRRGDFLNNPLHNVCSKEYFYRAVNEVTQVVQNPRLLIFSDDIDWVSESFNLDLPHSFATGLEDHMNHMRLMSLCRNHIIPNSTFSWWGAWLSKPQTVIAPDLWLTDDRQVHVKALGHWAETKHTVPENWKRIPACLPNEELM